MSDERDTLNVGTNGTSTERTTAEDRQETPAEKRRRLVSILNRGVVSDRLHVPLPDDMYGEWVRNDPLEIQRLENIGFKVDNEYAGKRALHSDGASGAIVGDLIFMTTDRETKNMIDDIRNEEFLKANGTKDQREEIEFRQSMANAGGDRAIVESKSSLARKDEIIAALKTQQ